MVASDEIVRCPTHLQELPCQVHRRTGWNLSQTLIMLSSCEGNTSQPGCRTNQNTLLRECTEYSPKDFATCNAPYICHSRARSRTRLTYGVGKPSTSNVTSPQGNAKVGHWIAGSAIRSSSMRRRDQICVIGKLYLLCIIS